MKTRCSVHRMYAAVTTTVNAASTAINPLSIAKVESIVRTWFTW